MAIPPFVYLAQTRFYAYECMPQFITYDSIMELRMEASQIHRLQGTHELML